VYDEIVQSVEFTPYVRREIRSLKLVETTVDSCEYKLEERSAFKTAFDQRGDCDDVILVKNGLLSDTSYSNIALFDGQEWHTPRVPLLYGTNRAQLLADGKIVEKDIAVADLKKYSQIALFNAMVEFGEVVLDVDCIQP
jgi:4-amino-4-deoxychorismate lyase